VRFTGRVDDRTAAQLLAQARALVVTATEEFGIAAVEAQAAGRPVIALAEGGVGETVVEGETGVFFHHNSAAALADAVAGFDPLSVDPAACVANAQRFDVARFQKSMSRVVEQYAAAQPTREVPRRAGRARGLALVN
jgi:glycosyltransferase involved in cell wall biosynthesis